ncbi:MAG: GntR family transcriptional regulator [Erysipelotrichia bacterium]|nr:GntR family transcriptional regulator [Erysipelotrichia bacterium]
MRDCAKYKIIENYITDAINSGKLKAGDQIETELQLSQQFNIGRITVNKALNNLANQGVLKRVAGKGSFVAEKILTKNMRSHNSFTEDMAALGKKAGSILLEYKVMKATEFPEIAKKFSISENDYIHYFVRIRTANDMPIALSYTYINSLVLPSINIKALEGSLKQQLVDAGVNIDGDREITLSSHLPTPEQKKLLNIGTVALLKNSHISYTAEGTAYEYNETYYLGDYYEYSFTVNRNNNH